MFSFGIQMRPDSEVRSGNTLSPTYYTAEIDSTYSFRGAVLLESSRVRESRFSSVCTRYEDFEIAQVNTAAIRRIEVRECSSPRKIGEVHGHRIEDGSERIVISELRPNDSKIRGAKGPLMYSFRRERDDTEIGWIETAGDAMAGSVVRRFWNKVRRNNQEPRRVWDGQVVSDVVDFRLILVASVLLDFNQL